MTDDRNESWIEQAKDKIKGLAGLPPGRNADGSAKSSTPDSPRGTLTSDDAEGLPPHQDVGTGLKPTE